MWPWKPEGRGCLWSSTSCCAGRPAVDVRVHGRPGPQTRRAADSPGVGPMGGEVRRLRDGASPTTQAEDGRLALQMPPPLRTRLATPVTMTANRLRIGVGQEP